MMQKETKKVLIITYYWPPGSGPGVQRFLKMSKFLRSFNWEPIILTVKNGSYPSTDDSLLQDIPKDMKVYKTKTLEPFTAYNKLTGGSNKQTSVGMIGLNDNKSLIKKISLFIRANLFLPDARRGWVKYARKQAKKIIKEHDIKAVITTGPPHSTHFTAYNLRKTFNLPWIADMRDPWTNIFYNSQLPRTSLTKKIDHKYENKILKNASYITTVSPGLKEEFEKINSNITVAYNGYDSEDIPVPTNFKKNYFTLDYIGNLKPNQNVQALWEAISELCNEDKEFRNNFRIQLTGNVDPGIINSLKHYKLEDISQIRKFVPHSEATNIMNKSNLLIFIVPQAKRNNFIITGKLFEYIAIKSPVLSIGPLKGDASSILEQSGRDKMNDYSDKYAIKNTILKYYNKWLNSDKFNFKHASDDFKKFSRYNATKVIAETLNKIT